MNHTAPRASTSTAFRRGTLLFSCVAAALVGTLLYQSATRPVDPAVTATGGPLGEISLSEPDRTTPNTGGAATEADGVLPEGATLFDDEYAGVANLDPHLLRSLRAAAADAAEDGVEFVVTSGWRSRDYQDQLLREAVVTYGSAEEAARWVATAETSSHVSGDAADIGLYDASAWLSRHGAAFGLCQIYGNESWHYELRPQATVSGCPPMYDDPTSDPRMRK
jgi:D-alanyl-D-alanine carboxypeptidase